MVTLLDSNIILEKENCLNKKPYKVMEKPYKEPVSVMSLNPSYCWDATVYKAQWCFKVNKQAANIIKTET